MTNNTNAVPRTEPEQVSMDLVALNNGTILHRLIRARRDPSRGRWKDVSTVFTEQEWTVVTEAVLAQFGLRRD